MAHFSSIYETSQQQIRHFHLKYTVLGNAAQTAKYQGEALCISNIQDIFHITIHVIIRFDIFTIGPTYQDKRHIQRGNLQNMSKDRDRGHFQYSCLKCTSSFMERQIR